MRMTCTDTGKGGPVEPSFPHLIWKRREFENYLCTEATLDAFACASAAEGTLPLFTASQVDTRRTAMGEAISDVSVALATLHRKSPWDEDVKARDEVFQGHPTLYSLDAVNLL